VALDVDQVGPDDAARGRIPIGDQINEPIAAALNGIGRAAHRDRRELVDVIVFEQQNAHGRLRQGQDFLTTEKIATTKHRAVSRHG